MKTISVVVPCYNEAENVEAMADAIRETFKRYLPDYRYELIFIDNDSSDGTREIIRRLCVEDEGIKAILNAKNFGQFNSPYYAMLQSTGDCTILMAADFQDPVEMIPRYVLEWEYGYKIVIGIKSSSRENKLMYWLRGCYYKMIKKLSDVEQIEQFTGFGLYDAAFIQVLRKLDDPTPFLRGIVAELGFRRKEIPYEQPRRRAEAGHHIRQHLLRRKHPGRFNLPDHEAGVLGAVCGRDGSAADRDVFFRLRADFLYRHGGGVRLRH